MNKASRSGSLEPKPDHLESEYGAQFGDPSVVTAYRHRPPYPEELFEILIELLRRRSIWR